MNKKQPLRHKVMRPDEKNEEFEKSFRKKSKKISCDHTTGMILEIVMRHIKRAITHHVYAPNEKKRVIFVAQTREK